MAEVKKLNVEPIGPRLVIKVDEPETLAGGNIFIPEKYRAMLQGHLTGVVVAVGNGWYTPDGVLIQLRCKVGDRVAWAGGVGGIMVVGNDKYMVVHEDNVYARMLPETGLDEAGPAAK